MNTTGEYDLRKFVAPEIIFGIDARYLSGRYVRNLGARKVLIVSDQGVTDAGWTRQIIDSINDENLQYEVFSDVTPNPRSEQVMAGARVCRELHCDAIVAVGGGSVMDCAKGIGIACSNGRDILEFEGADQVPLPGPPLICVPTTAGSSADVSQFAIITDTRRSTKIAIVSKTMVPDVALIDPVTTVTMDAYLTACTGIDAMTHAVEAYVSNAHSHISSLHALEGIRLISGNISHVLKDQDNIELRSRMMLGSMYAGLAFSNASLGLVHSMAHSLGGRLDFAHGECNAVLLRHVVSYNYDAVPERYQKIGEAMGVDIQNISAEGRKDAILSAFYELNMQSGVERTLGQIGVKKSDIPHLAENAMQDVCLVTNPRMPERKDIEEIYEKAL